VDVGLEQRKAYLAHRRRDIVLRQRAALAHLSKRSLELLRKRIEHGRLILAAPRGALGTGAGRSGGRPLWRPGRASRRRRRSLGGQDLRLLLAFRGQDRSAPVALGAHLLLHRRPDVCRRIDGLDLDAVYADAPLAGRLVENDAKLRVDVLARGERRLEREPTD